MNPIDGPRAWLLAPLVLGLAACQLSPARPQPAAELDALLRHLHAQWGFDGAMVVSEPGGRRWERGIGMANAESGLPFTPDTPADGGSIAKTFTAAAALLLAAEGRLDLEDAVARHLPEFPYPDVRLRHLLAHSSGLPDYDAFEKELAGRASSNALLLELLAAGRPPLRFEPGSRFEYSSLAYDLMALLVERVSGQGYEAFLRRRVFGPLGMPRAFVRPARFADWPGPRTRGYAIEGGKRVPRDVFDLEGFHGGSNLYLAARDLDHWNRGWLDGALPAPVRDAAARADAFPGGLRSALSLGSWYHSGDGSRAWYTGHWRGFYSMAFRDAARGRSIAYVTNTDPPMWLRPLIVQAVARILDGAAFEPLLAPAFIALESVGDVAGRYELPGVGRLALRRDGAAWFGQWEGRPEVRAFQVSGAVLVAPGYDAWLWFTRGPAGSPRLHWTTVLESVGSLAAEPAGAAGAAYRYVIESSGRSAGVP